MAGRAEPVAGDGVALLAQLRLAQAATVPLHHLGAERLGAEARVLVGVGAAQSVCDVERAETR